MKMEGWIGSEGIDNRIKIKSMRNGSVQAEVRIMRRKSGMERME